MSDLRTAVEQAIAVEEARHAGAMDALRSMLAPASVAAPALSVQERRVVGASNRQRVLDLLADGPLARAEIHERTGIPAGSMGGVLGKLVDAGEIVRDGEQRNGAKPSPIYRLARQAPDEPDDPSAEPIDPERRAEVVAFLSERRCGAVGVADGLLHPVTEIAPLLDAMVEAGDLNFTGTVYEVAS